jgi:hypothetical protein
VEGLPFRREVNAIADRHHLMVAQLGGYDRPPQALLLLSPGVECVYLLQG